MIDYKRATVKDVSSLKELWLNTFSDKPLAVDLFFNNIFSEDIAFVAQNGLELVAMVYLINTSVNDHKACYLYAAATKESYRKQGIMKNLIGFALANTNTELCVTLPASESLYSYYSKLGFEPLTSNTATVSRQELSELSKPYAVQDLFISGYCGARNRILKNNFLFWNNKHINYAFDYNSIYGAKIIKSNFGYAIFYEEDTTCIVLEIICADSNAPYLITDILSATDCDVFKFHLSPNQRFINSAEKTFAMVKYMTDYRPEKIYTGLTLD